MSVGVEAGAGVAAEVRGGVGLGFGVCVGAGVESALVPATPTVGGAESHAANASAMRARASAGAVHDLLRNAVELQGLVDAQGGLGEPG